MADLGDIGSARVSVELDFEKAIRDATTTLNTQIERLFQDAAKRANDAFSNQLDIQGGLKQAASGVSTSDLERSFKDAGDRASASFSDSLASGVSDGADSAAKDATDTFSKTAEKGMQEAGTSSSGAFATEASKGAAIAGKQAGLSFSATANTSFKTAALKGAKSFGASLAPTTRVASAAAGRSSGTSFGEAFSARLATISSTLSKAFTPFATKSSAAALAAGRRAGTLFAEGMVTRIRSGLAASSALLTRVLSPAVALIGTLGAASSVKQTLDLAKTQKLLADTYGFTAQQAGEYAAVAKTLDVPQQTLVTSFNTLTKSIVAARTQSQKFGFAASDLRDKISSNSSGLAQNRKAISALGTSEKDLSDRKKLLADRTALLNQRVQLQTKLYRSNTVGAGKQIEAFHRLGVTNEMLRRGNVNEIFEQASEGLKGLKSRTDKAYLSSVVFGRGFAGLRPLIKDGRDGIRAAADEAERYGAVISDQRDVQKFVKAQHQLSGALLGLQVQLGMRLLPVLAKWATSLTEFIATSKPLRLVLSGIGSAVSGIVKGFQGFARSFTDAFSDKSGQDSAKTFSGIMKDLGKAVGDLAEKWLPKLGTVLGTIVGFMADHTTTAKVFLGLFVASKIIGFKNALGLVLPLLKNLVLILLEIDFAAVGASIVGLGGAIGGLTAAFGGLILAIAPVAAAIGVAAGGFLLAYNNSKLFRQATQAISDAALAMIPGLDSATKSLSDFILAQQDLGPATKSTDLTKQTQAFAAFQAQHPELHGAALAAAYRKLNPEIIGTNKAQNELNAATGKGTAQHKRLAAATGATAKGFQLTATEARNAGPALQAAARNTKNLGNAFKNNLSVKTTSAARAGIANVSTVFRRFASNIFAATVSASTFSSVMSFIPPLMIAIRAQVTLLNLSLVHAVHLLRVQLVAAFLESLTAIRRVILSFSLFSAGVHVMATFLSGLRSGFAEVQDFIHGIAKWIKDNKGPISADRKLLVPAGRAIMHGFNDGLQNRWQPVQKWVKDIGGFFKGAVSGATLNAPIANILLGKGTIKDLNEALSSSLGLPPGFTIGAGGPLGFLHPTSGWPDTLSQVRLIEKMFGVGMTSGLRTYDTVAGASVSQHVLGQAADFGTSRGSFGALTKLATFASKLVSKIFKQVIWLNSLWAGGTPGHGFVPNHMDHVHLGWQPRAAGGQARKDRTYQWNERGREMFMPNTNGYIWNASNTKALVSALKTLKPSQSNSRSIGTVEIHTQQVDARSLTRDLGSVFSRA